MQKLRANVSIRKVMISNVDNAVSMNGVWPYAIQKRGYE